MRKWERNRFIYQRSLYALFTVRFGAKKTNVGPYREERNPKNCERKLMGEGIFRILSAVRKEIRRRAPRDASRSSRHRKAAEHFSTGLRLPHLCAEHQANGTTIGERKTFGLLLALLRPLIFPFNRALANV
ncbi:unnamed protein product [Heligmosomoides polygyrus]|uniref:Uncharacterized protein n=1 Tax=Heligmosomoides polygyrus TaxID=6339 RepID=A0A183GMZ7_HELPZ|nr:unnamed protein product [Heligmosomoides polygyrus]